MELDSANKALAQIRLEGRAPDLQSLKIGQVLNATVIQTRNAGEVTLRINGVDVQAKTPQPLTAGQQITVRITSLGRTPSLEIVSTGTTGTTTSRALPGVTTPPLIMLATGKPGSGTFAIGQRFLALVTAAQDDGALHLQTTAGRLTGRTSASLTTGQLLELIAVRAGKLPAVAVTHVSDGPEIINPLLRAALPRQQGLPLLMAILTSLRAPCGNPPMSLPSAVQEAIQNLMRNLSGSKDASSAQGLKSAMLNSGMFLESRMFGQSSPATDSGIGSDFKSGLFRLIEALLRGSLSAPGQFTGTPRTAAPHAAPPLRGSVMQAQARAAPAMFSTVDELLGVLLQQADGVLARLQISQLAALPAQDQAQPYLTFELPLRHGNQVDVIQLRITRDATGSQDEAARQWTIHIAFDLEHLGPVHARLTLQNRHISTMFWAEQPRTADLFERHLAELQGKLASAGLTVGAMRCQTGKPPPVPGHRTPELLRNLEA
ncbi:MAG: hypothetical protein FD165_179 [Gammaproteobacteria bacterium]|nr:MAG: hypothetical protein FD165_179 [Gammaproteobacteria bacterium]TND06757.1 MAG: hypothetical protein FD120_489 [Gammaproteobacteria bacterium]